MSDVTLVTEGKKFKSSKALLSSRCKFFQAMFCRFQEGDSNEVTVSVPPAFLEKVLQYLTEGELSLKSFSAENTAKLLIHSDYLMLGHL